VAHGALTLVATAASTACAATRTASLASARTGLLQHFPESRHRDDQGHERDGAQLRAENPHTIHRVMSGPDTERCCHDDKK